MLIRTEIGSDIPRISSFIRDDLQQPKIADKVAKIREQALITLGMLAIEDTGRLVGYIICSPVLVNEEDLGWLTISVLMSNLSDQYTHLAQALTSEAIESLYEFGYNAVVLFSEDYPHVKTGFVLANKLSLKGSSKTKVWVNPLYDAEAAMQHAEITLPDLLQPASLLSNLVAD